MFLERVLKSAYNKKINGKGLAVFRMVYSIILLAEICQIFYFRHLVYDVIPYIVPGATDPTIPLILWMLTVIFIFFGAFTRTTTIINYAFSIVFIGTITSYEYHMFYAWMGINFMLIFLPISQCLSIDALRIKLKYSNTRFQFQPTDSVSSLAYIIPVFVGIGFVYFDSIFFKSTSFLWLHGLGMWLPASLPMMSHLNGSLLLNNEILIKFLGYLTFVFELLFIFLFWFKKFRLPLLIIGIGLHVGILLEFPIPWFAMGVIAIYLLMVPTTFWEKIKVRKAKYPKLKFYYDAECPLCIRTKILIEHFDWIGNIKFLSIQFYSEQEEKLKGKSQADLLANIHSVDYKGKVYVGIGTYIRVLKFIWFLKPLFYIIRIPIFYSVCKSIYAYIAANRTTERCTEDNCGYTPPPRPVADDKIKIMGNFTVGDFKFKFVYAGLLVLILLQLNVTYNSALIVGLRRNLEIDNTKVGGIVSVISNKFSFISKSMFGITPHAVFMDRHFDNYNHIIGVVYKTKDGNEIHLPIVDEKGTPDKYIYGFNWVKWTFRVNSPIINQEKLAVGIRDFTAFWAMKNNISLDDATFFIKVKKIEIPREWQYDFLNKQIKNPWLDGGQVKWKNKKFVADIKDIESI